MKNLVGYTGDTLAKSTGQKIKMKQTKMCSDFNKC